MVLGAWSALEWLALIEYELLLFAAAFFLLGAIDEFAVDIIWIWLRITGRARTPTIDRQAIAQAKLRGRAAVLIPAWDEAQVIGHTIGHALRAWPQDDLRLYVGCYRNDPATARIAELAANGDPRVQVVVNDFDGPTTKADCLNGLYRAMQQTEGRSGLPARVIVLHDAEDMVDAAALSLIDAAIEIYDFVQIPVLPQPQPRSRWIGSHYLEEFAEAHGKTMIVRSAMGAGLPAAGVGCAFARETLDAMARRAGDEGPFSHQTLTEDYELGLKVAAAGGRSKMLRVRGSDGQLVATRAYFPSSLGHAVRQKARWMHGIAFQGWDRLGWGGGIGEKWMRLRDRRGPLSALVLFTGYILLLLAAFHLALNAFGYAVPWRTGPLLQFLLWANFFSLLWRAAMRFAFTARDYGWLEGLRAVLRLPVSNIIAMMAARRAVFAYIRTLGGAPPQWDKTAHDDHPAALILRPGSGK